MSESALKTDTILLCGYGTVQKVRSIVEKFRTVRGSLEGKCW